VVDSQTRVPKYTRLTISHVYITRVWRVAVCFMGHVAQWPRVFTVQVANCTIRNSRIYHASHTWQPVCHVYGLHTRGDLQVAKCNFFCSER